MTEDGPSAATDLARPAAARWLRLAPAALSATLLAGCYVVPIAPVPVRGYGPPVYRPYYPRPYYPAPYPRGYYRGYGLIDEGTAPATGASFAEASAAVTELSSQPGFADPQATEHIALASSDTGR